MANEEFKSLVSEADDELEEKEELRVGRWNKHKPLGVKSLKEGLDGGLEISLDREDELEEEEELKVGRGNKDKSSGVKNLKEGLNEGLEISVDREDGLEEELDKELWDSVELKLIEELESETEPEC